MDPTPPASFPAHALRRLYHPASLATPFSKTLGLGARLRIPALPDRQTSVGCSFLIRLYSLAGLVRVDSRVQR